MRMLIAISSTAKEMGNGSNQAVRDSYVQDIAKYPGLDYRFFIGDGTPRTDAEDYCLFKSLEADEFTSHRERIVNQRSEAPVPIPDPASDEVLLHVPDDYVHISYKTKEKLRWTVEHGYDFVLCACTDTFIHVSRLMNSTCEHDYAGDAGYRPDTGWYVGGGSGILLSRRSAEAIVNDTDPIMQWAEDWWIGVTLLKHGINPHHDCRYAYIGKGFPNKDNDFITGHLYDTNLNKGTPYNPQMMRDVYKLSKEK